MTPIIDPGPRWDHSGLQVIFLSILAPILAPFWVPPGPIWGHFWAIVSISALVGNFGLLVGSVGWLVALLG